MENDKQGFFLMAEDDDLLASLGGSLLKDMLADLQDDDDNNGAGWLSLEELEQELSQLDSKRFPPNDIISGEHVQLPPLSAASLVVGHHHTQMKQQHQQQNQTYLIQELLTTTTTTMVAPAAPQDAWSLSLQRFSDATEFLQADSARRQQAPSKGPSTVVNNIDLSAAQEYNITELPKVVAPPPGMYSMSAENQVKNREDGDDSLQQAANTLLAGLQQQSASDPPNRANKVPSGWADKSHILDEPLLPTITTQAPNIMLNLVRPEPITPQNSVSFLSDVHPQPTPLQYQQQQQQQQQQQHSQVTDLNPTLSTTYKHPSAQDEIVQNIVLNADLPTPLPSHSGPVTSQHPLPAVHIAVPVARAATWKLSTAPLDTPAPRVILCHPRATPIPASHLASQFMSARDIAYVVHSILKTMTVISSPTDYDELYFAKQSGGTIPTSPSFAHRLVADEQQRHNGLEARAQKAKDWSFEHATLGHVAKINVARPRALIAHPVSLIANSNNSVVEDQKRRASLWKSRVYCDRAYQAFLAVIENWRSGSSVANVHPHIIKLLKCLGVTSLQQPSTTTTAAAASLVIDSEPMQLIRKVDKGRVLLARILEQALLPPQAMLFMLPTIWSVFLAAPSSLTAPGLGQPVMSTPTDDRMFLALARVVTSLPNLDGRTSLLCLESVLKQSMAVLETTSRMQAAHALLQRGASIVASSKDDEDLQVKWSKTETEFIGLLQGSR